MQSNSQRQRSLVISERNTCFHLIFFHIYLSILKESWLEHAELQTNILKTQKERNNRELLSRTSVKQRACVSRAQCITFGLLENICHLSGLQSKQNPLLLDLHQLGKFCCANYLGRQRGEKADSEWHLKTTFTPEKIRQTFQVTGNHRTFCAKLSQQDGKSPSMCLKRNINMNKNK